ncbi:hypothetical protein [Vibrio mediterranei]|uniref:hypothetical protein n=1 Tax=Vibrio mediterranei TaxID=689 RepID=UPI0040694895
MQIVKNINEGQRFGMLTAVCKGSEKDAAGAYKIYCECSCGGSKEIASSSLRSGKTTSCGCQQKRYREELVIRQLHNFDLTRQYGLIQPLNLGGTNREGLRMVRAKCLGCGSSKMYLATNLRNGYSRTCGRTACIAKFHEQFPDAPKHPKTAA